MIKALDSITADIIASIDLIYSICLHCQAPFLIAEVFWVIGVVFLYSQILVFIPRRFPEFEAEALGTPTLSLLL